MTNEELNFRLQVCAEAGMPYSDKLWSMLAAAWDRGYAQGKDDGFCDGKNYARRICDKNPFRDRGAPAPGVDLGSGDYSATVIQRGTPAPVWRGERKPRCPECMFPAGTHFETCPHSPMNPGR